MVAVLSYLEEKTVFLKERTVFEPEALQAMSQAFEDACNALRIFVGDEYGREVIAARVIDLARMGVVDANTLRERVLFEARAAA